MNRLTYHILCIIFLQTTNYCAAQELSYIHYSTKDGLAGTTIYDLCQDKDGFIWFATETGLSRFDGNTFKNYTVADGLPDNEILKVFADSYGRVWIIPFKKTICYYYQNKLHTSENNELLRNIIPESFFNDIDEDEHKNILLADTRKVLIIQPDNTIIPVYTPEKGRPVNVLARKNYLDKGFVISINDSVFHWKDGLLLFDRIEKMAFDRRVLPLTAYKDERQIFVRIPHGYISYQTYGSFVRYINTHDGTYITDTINKTIGHRYLIGKKISRTMEDREKNLWFATLGDGVYKLPSKDIKTIQLNTPKQGENTEVFSLSKSGSNLICGLGFSNAVFLNNDKIFKRLSFSRQTLAAENSSFPNRLVDIKTLNSGVTMFGFDAYLAKLEKDITTFKNIYPVKTIDEINKDFILVGTSKYAFKVAVKDLQVVDTIWVGRTTKVFYFQNKYYIGTLNGLYEIDEKKESKYLGSLHPALKGRITDILHGADGTLYVATADHGLILYNNGKIVSQITSGNGLSSNICRTLFFYKNHLFIGTNNGINKVDVLNRNNPILKYSISDGLPSDIINAMYVADDTIWTGTPAGLTYFNEKNISSTDICNTVLLSVKSSGKEVSPNENLQLSYKHNTIEFDFAGISFKSGGDIDYYYKLEGLDSKWNTTRQNTLRYESLPFGNYKFQLYAVNKFGLKSNVINVNFHVSRAFWKNPWLYAILFVATILFTVWIVNRKNKRAQLIRNEQYKTQLQLATLEQQALQAQMNPHFIFNCLNSIQQYILTNDKEKANQFLTDFASLVRQTLENSDKKKILLSEEVDYLRKYLQMEKMRFANNFDYTINVAPDINQNSIEIPALLLQPFVENCLRHGIRYKEDGSGFVHISFLLCQKTLVCTIRDNGVGRAKASEYKSKQHIEYQSKGIRLTEKRIELINKISNAHVTYEIIDLRNNNGFDAGTEVKVNIPINMV